MGEQLQALLKKRRTQKGQITRFANYLEGIDKDNVDRIDGQRRLQGFEDLNKAICATFAEMIELAEEEEIDPIITEKLDYEEQYYQLCSKFDKRMQLEESTIVSSVSSQNNLNTPNVKLPVIDLPKFGGLIEDWLSFKDIFDSLINKNASLSEVQRFHYLKGCLRNSAANVIQSLAICDANYSVAWEMLTKQFENKKVIVETHLKKLFTLPVIEQESASAIRDHFNNLMKNVRALQAINQPTIDSLLIYLSTSKFDSVSFDKWQEYSLRIELPTLKDLEDFLSDRCQILNSRTVPQPSKKVTIQPVKRISSGSHVTVNTQCAVCKDNHYIQSCNVFHNMTLDDKYHHVRKNGLCYNCLRKNHRTNQCNSVSCAKCGRKHNILLHAEPTAGTSSADSSPHSSTRPERAPELRSPALSHAATSGEQKTLPVDSSHNKGTVIAASNTDLHMTDNSQVLLSTVLLNVRANDGTLIECRALLDNASQSNLISEELANKLNVKRRSTNISLHGVGGSNSKIKGLIDTTISSQHNDYSIKLSFLVLTTITQNLPSSEINVTELRIPHNIILADPTFTKVGKISMLLGAEIFYELLCQGQIQPLANGPILQKTLLGWVVAGKYKACHNSDNRICNVACLDKLHEQVEKFWELENVTSESPTNLSLQQIASEEHFVSTVRRTETGRFIVKLPFNENIQKLGMSKQSATTRFASIERKLARNADLSKQYSSFMREYEALGHMKRLDTDDGAGYYLPHHAVLKEDSITTKLRVVFDGSAKSSTGLSLNDTLHVGAPVQDMLFDIMLRFRKYAVVFTTDIEKMYRQILISEDDRKYQKVLWRTSPEDRLQTYVLNTVTYGTSSAPFLATRCLSELARIEYNNFPRASAVLKDDAYVDDIISGCDNLEEATELKRQLEELLRAGGFPLQKWRSNVSSLVNPPDSPEFVVNSATTSKTLGLLWNSQEDSFHYTTTAPSQESKVTKRTILSHVSMLFDPLELLGGIVISAKILLQQLWKLNLHWDEAVPTSIYTAWCTYRDNLQDIVTVKIPRHVLIQGKCSVIELHGFCDASERAYGACIYLKTIDDSGAVLVRLLCAKSRVAPVKQQTIPRLELCSAVLLAELSEKVRKIMKLEFSSEHYWTDSTIVLAWLSSFPSRWNTFVANRISKIQELVPSDKWRHVRTNDNPADIISRGVTPTELSECDKWWCGPEFLQFSEENWPRLPTVSSTDIPETRRSNALVTVSEDKFGVLERYSSFKKLRRVIAYALRFINNCKSKNREVGLLTVSELRNAGTAIVKLVQGEVYHEEIELLRKARVLKGSSKILSLNPFLDIDGVLRVGGRLQNAAIPYEQKHPCILPPKHHVTTLIVTMEHLRHLHAGQRATLAAIRTRYWPVSGMSTVKRVLRNCVRCSRAKPTPVTHIMGQLPLARVQPSRAFSTSGVDYCGPFHIRTSNRRGSQLIKAYVAVFVCFSTRAVHLELVGDLTTESCLAAIKRFVARRGLVCHLYSDNATNFVGSRNVLREVAQLFADAEGKLLEDNIQWHFIPARSPHFGGIWESAVKSCKHHLRRVAGDANLTYEELSTLLTQVEACLNSRPLVALTEDPGDTGVLTPGHFLIGEALTTPQEDDLHDVNTNRLSKWQRIQQLHQSFWKQWSKEVLCQMQARNKWKREGIPLAVGSLVTIRDDNQPPLKWKLGRVLDLHPGKDNVPRVATVKTPSGVVTITVTKLCPIPSSE